MLAVRWRRPWAGTRKKPLGDKGGLWLTASQEVEHSSYNFEELNLANDLSELARGP